MHSHLFSGMDGAKKRQKGNSAKAIWSTGWCTTRQTERMQKPEHSQYDMPECTSDMKLPFSNEHMPGRQQACSGNGGSYPHEANMKTCGSMSWAAGTPSVNHGIKSR